MRSRLPIHLAAVACAALFSAAAAAETLYKLIDKNGKVTYSEEKPKSFDGQVIRLDIDPNANTATLEKPQPPAPGANRPLGEAPAGVRPEDVRVSRARVRLEAAQKALQDARDNPQEGDVMRIGKVGGGARSAPSDAYQQRLDGLDADVKNAQDELRRAEQAR